MEYEVKNIEWVGTVKQKDENTFSQSVNVKTGIVNQVHPGFTNTDTVEIEFPAKGLDADGIKALIAEKAAEFSAKKYPNT